MAVSERPKLSIHEGTRRTNPYPAQLSPPVETSQSTRLRTTAVAALYPCVCARLFVRNRVGACCTIGRYPLCGTERTTGLCVELAADVGEQFAGVKVWVELAVA